MDGPGDPWNWFDCPRRKVKNGSSAGHCKYCLQYFKQMDASRIRAHILRIKKKGVSICPCPGKEAIEDLSPPQQPRTDASANAAPALASAAAARGGMAAWLNQPSSASPSTEPSSSTQVSYFKFLLFLHSFSLPSRLES